MANSIFNHPAFNFFGRPTMDDFLKNAATDSVNSD